MTAEPLIGKRFGRLVVECETHSSSCRSGPRRQVLARCDCGTEKVAPVNDLRQGRIKSCGCLQREVRVSANTTHGCSGTAEYKVWKGIISRCELESASGYGKYGARGIQVCERWRESFSAFLEDMGKRPSPAHSIDRFPDADGDYKPSNCRWATPIEQTWSHERVHRVSVGDQKVSMREACRILALSYPSVQKRVSKGISPQEAIERPFRGGKPRNCKNV